MKDSIILAITDCLRYDLYEKTLLKERSALYLKLVYSSAPSTYFAVPSILTGTLPFQIIKNAFIDKNIYTYIPLLASATGRENIFITANVVTSRAFGYYIPKGYFEDFIKSRNIPSKFSEKADLFTIAKEQIRKIPLLRSLLKSKLFLQFKYFVNKKRLEKNPWSKVNVLYDSKIRISNIQKQLKLALEELKGPFFIFLHLMETHAPYGAPTLPQRMLRRGEKLMKKLYAAPKLLKPSEVEAIKELYQSEVEYLDVSLNQLIDFIDRKLRLENTLVIVMSDHGEAFGEEGIFTHPDNALIEPILHVPLAFFGEPAKRIRIEGEGVLPSWKVHELIVKMLFGQEEIIIKREKSMLAIGYRKIANESNKPVYALTNAAIISREGIKTLDLSNPENRQLVENILQMKRREYLKQKLANRVYGFKIGDFFKGGNID